MATKKKAIKKAAPKKVAGKAPVKKAAVKKDIPRREFCKPIKGFIPACEPTPMTNPSHAIINILEFMGTRDKEIILSKHHDIGPAIVLAAEFIKANNLPTFPCEAGQWLPAPTNTDYITNVPPIGYHEKAIASEPLTVEKAEDQMLGAILGMSTANQDATIAGFLQKILTQRNNRVQNMQKVISDVEHDMQDAMASLTTLNSVLRGEFAVVKS